MDGRSIRSCGDVRTKMQRHSARSEAKSQDPSSAGSILLRTQRLGAISLRERGLATCGVRAACSCGGRAVMDAATTRSMTSCGGVRTQIRRHSARSGAKSQNPSSAGSILLRTQRLGATKRCEGIKTSQTCGTNIRVPNRPNSIEVGLPLVRSAHASALGCRCSGA